MIELIRASRVFDHGRGVIDISLSVAKGDWVAVIGPAGAGKSTLLKMIYAYEFPDSGEVIVGPHRLSSLRRKDIPQLRRMLGIVDQHLELIVDRTAYENVTLVGEVLGWPRRKTRNETLRALNSVGLYGHLESYPDQLSFGERRRLAIARALVAEPFALIADEPLGHLDRDTALGIVDLLAQIHSQGTALLIASHRPEFYKGYPVKFVKLDRGQIVDST